MKVNFRGIWHVPAVDGRLRIFNTVSEFRSPMDDNGQIACADNSCVSMPRDSELLKLELNSDELILSADLRWWCSTLMPSSIIRLGTNKLTHRR